MNNTSLLGVGLSVGCEPLETLWASMEATLGRP
jgi:hypothetical protein